MKVTILGSGTSQGVPVIACECAVCKSSDPKDNRLRSSVSIEIDSKIIVIDAGPDFRYQMLRSNTKNIRAILLTHEHKDHLAGMDDVRAFNLINQGKAMDIYGNERTLNVLRHDFSYAFGENRYPGVPTFETHAVDKDGFYIDDIYVEPINLLHYKLPILGYKIGKFAYITDLTCIAENCIDKLMDLDVLVIESLRQKAHISHLSLNESLAIIKKLRAKKAYLTHISHDMGLHAEVSKILPDNVELAYDTLSIEL